MDLQLSRETAFKISLQRRQQRQDVDYLHDGMTAFGPYAEFVAESGDGKLIAPEIEQRSGSLDDGFLTSVCETTNTKKRPPNYLGGYASRPHATFRERRRLQLWFRRICRALPCRHSILLQKKYPFVDIEFIGNYETREIPNLILPSCPTRHWAGFLPAHCANLCAIWYSMVLVLRRCRTRLNANAYTLAGRTQGTAG